MQLRIAAVLPLLAACLSAFGGLALYWGFTMPEEGRKQVFLTVDALIRDFKAKKTYAQ